MNTETEPDIERFKKTGVLAFCPKCGSSKSEFRRRCRACGSDPRATDVFLAKSILMSTECYYMRSKDWTHRTPKDNAIFVEQKIIPKLLAAAARLRSGEQVEFDSEGLNYWVQRIQREKKQKLPKSLLFFVVLLFASVLLVVALFLRTFFLR